MVLCIKKEKSMYLRRINYRQKSSGYITIYW